MRPTLVQSEVHRPRVPAVVTQIKMPSRTAKAAHHRDGGPLPPHVGSLGVPVAIRRYIAGHRLTEGRSVRVLFDAYWWGKGPGANRTVQREFICAWMRDFPEDEVVLAIRGNAWADPVPEGARRVRTHLWPHAVSNRVELARLTQQTRSDVVICHNYAPMSVRSVVFIHDVMFVEHPEWFTPSERLYFAPMLRWARSAMAVATSTQTEADRVMRVAPRLRPPVVTGLAIPSALGTQHAEPTVRLEERPYALTVGRLNVRKNLRHLLESAIRSTSIRPDQPLLVVGTTAHSGHNTTLPLSVSRAVESGAIRMVGGVTDGELANLYQHASLVITLSLDEGFGMPAIEAAHFGAPLLASDIPVFRETVGDYACFTAPRNEQQVIADAIDAAWGRRPHLARRESLAERYTWSRAVAELRGRTVSELRR